MLQSLCFSSPCFSMLLQTVLARPMPNTLSIEKYLPIIELQPEGGQRENSLKVSVRRDSDQCRNSSSVRKNSFVKISESWPVKLEWGRSVFALHCDCLRNKKRSAIWRKAERTYRVCCGGFAFFPIVRKERRD